MSADILVLGGGIAGMSVAWRLAAAERLMVSPADATPCQPCDAQPEELDIAVAMDRLQQVTTLDARHVFRRWAGLRTFAPDHSPVIGEDPDAKGFIWLAGQGGFGVMTSPAMSALGAAAAMGGTIPATIAAARIRTRGYDPLT